jgi:hypothetical protein
MKNVLTIALLLSALSGSGQFRNISVTAGPNYTFLPDYRETSMMQYSDAATGFISYSSYEYRRSSNGKTGAGVSFGFEYGLSGKFYFASGLAAENYRYSTAASLRPVAPLLISPNVPVTTGTPFGQFYGFPGGYGELTSPFVLGASQPDDVSLYFIGVPVMAGTRIWKDKLAIETGINVAAMVGAVTRKTGYTFSSQESTFQSPWRPDEWITVQTLVPHEYRYSTSGTEGFNTFQISAVLRTSFRLAAHLDATAAAQLFVTSLYEQESSRQKSIQTGVRWRW